MADIIDLQATRRARRTPAAVFPRLITQDEIDAQVLRKQRRARARSAWLFTRGVLMWLGIIALLGFIVGPYQ
ncbi:hypothetical protein FDH38_gp111 [Dinoroseobacter phage vB_DshS-R5C]|uniref:Uncharacterized protein n=1 Tax=Dinoroseobacter phage vB_DshS-R5C TaxID=1965368 RepID=A0A1V0DYE0_9CAUD|nr:hypothetical protein FDH38_gp111 [Dinoroseobacter phage vB_DshS-R5C]ARB06165.1 hypothetical protein vBDshSR5C_111 [Dinoroseobacter phage vB_DshS-R5C]